MSISTNKQTQVLELIREFKSREGNYPTLNQLAKELGLKSVSTVHHHVSELLKNGQLVQTDDLTGYELPEYSDLNQSLVPILGYIKAGSPIEAIEDTDPKTITVKNLPRSGDFYALIAKGDSMVDEGIYDGDTVVIKKQSQAYDGQTVVAVIDGGNATLKKLYREKRGFRLQPANQTMMPIFRDEVEVRGIVWEIRRPESKIAYVNKKSRVKKLIKHDLRTLDLFAGIGGIRIGFERAGFNTVFANDFEKACKHTYDLNFDNSKLVVEDITKIKADELPEFDFLLGGFPCQAFSVAGYRQGFNDLKGRGNLFFDIARFLEARKPSGFMLENVKNLKTHDGGKTFTIIQDALGDLGYHIKYKVLNSMEYGNVPQNRERIFIVGFKDQSILNSFEFPEPVKLTKQIKDILESEVHERYYYNGKPLYEKLKNDINEENAVYQWRRQYVRKNKKGVSPTLTANMGMGGHNVPIIFDSKGIRKLTPRECARIQGYPDDYKLPAISDSALYKQIGNSVTVPVIEAIACKMRLAIDTTE